ncbi:MAG: DUF211 domain-containing protein [Myxococcota bacterium]|nr:DUF211 domain-containing protein [Myxococcota bacterium]
MPRLKRVLLDVLAPHDPSVLELGRVLASQAESHVRLSVVEMDARTQTLRIDIAGPEIDFDRVQAAITDCGASLHSIDEVEIEGESEPRG